MSDEDAFEFEVRSRVDAKTEVVIRFRSLARVMPALEALDRIVDAQKQMSSILTMRASCEAQDNQVFLPAGNANLPKARWVSLAAAASFPRGVPVNSILKQIDLTASELSAYCTSKNNPTSKYLYMKDDLLFIRGEGIEWVFGLLTKDKQIGNPAERARE